MAIQVCQKKIIHTKAEEVCQPASDPPNQAQLREEDATNHNVEEKLEVIDTPLTFTLANVKEKIREAAQITEEIKRCGGRSNK